MLELWEMQCTPIALRFILARDDRILYVGQIEQFDI